jgi:Domain of unknown function (DUF5076)
MSDAQSLPIPDQVTQAMRKVEMARIWLADGEPVVVLSPIQWKDPANWGLLLVDLARHVASAYAQLDHDLPVTLERIHAAFEAEWEHPTSLKH